MFVRLLRSGLTSERTCSSGSTSCAGWISPVRGRPAPTLPKSRCSGKGARISGDKSCGSPQFSIPIPRKPTSSAIVGFNRMRSFLWRSISHVVKPKLQFLYGLIIAIFHAFQAIMPGGEESLRNRRENPFHDLQSLNIQEQLYASMQICQAKSPVIGGFELRTCRCSLSLWPFLPQMPRKCLQFGF